MDYELELDLTGLTAEELQHIKYVLTRDRSLNEKTKPLNPSFVADDVNKNVKGPVSTGDLVLAEIERVHNADPDSPSGKQFKDSRCIVDAADNDSCSDSIFSAFTDMISKSIDFGTPKKESAKGSIMALAKSMVNMEMKETSKVPFKYNPRESVKQKPTLLELSAKVKRDSVPAIFGIGQGYIAEEDDILSTRRRSRSNALYSSSIVHTLPRTRKTVDQKTNSEVRERKSFYPPSFIEAQSGKLESEKGSASISRENSFPASSDSKQRTYPRSKKTKQKENNRETIVKEEYKDASKESSSDSGISHKDEVHMSSKNPKDTKINLYDDDEGEYNLNYEPDTESEEEDVIGVFDSLSLISASTLGLSSNSNFGTEIVEENDLGKETKEIYVKSVSQTPRASPWLNHKQRREKYRNTIQTSIDSGRLTNNTSAPSPCSSPSTSHKSMPSSGASSPVVFPNLRTKAKREHIDSVGTLDISIIYYTAESFKGRQKRAKLPQNGTKSPEQKHCDILTRKEYVAVTGSKLLLSKGSLSGAPPKMDGEMHVVIKGAKFSPEILRKNKSPSTYVKCYLLPDKFHNSKMKSSVIKKSQNPQWDHKFIFAGFSQAELKERCLEICVGSWHFKKKDIVGGVVLSSGPGVEASPWIRSNKQESYLWNTALLMSGNKISISVPLRAGMKPFYN